MTIERMPAAETDCTEEILQQAGFCGDFPGIHELLSWAVFDKMAAFRRY
ncbi:MULTISPECIES: hypothetical protein [unclassified Herbaspirillum]|nr:MULTISPECIES: hypothetical protein [unclassified Herbaspirillum]MBB5392516.1 hypothetical protein [Herbaspirillum sp. SJZ102]TQK06154.1 hypothetical protein FB599_2300 [Herbaspirillum sp. SJZ130]TQK12368.1 hypothetical protein FB598_2320 [Herbaspirillum sp. SJZ106]TWC68363.1 hypothetical protein FB597_103246 [Herbaspirillum sp. SJZ099]